MIKAGEFRVGSKTLTSSSTLSKQNLRSPPREGGGAATADNRNVRRRLPEAL